MNILHQNVALRNLSALVDFSNLINSNLDLNFTLHNLLLTCFSKFFATKGVIAIFDKDGLLKVAASKGIPADALNSFPAVTIENYESSNDLSEFLFAGRLVVTRKIITSQTTRGCLFLGEKLDKSDYSEEDLDFLGTIINIGATAIENSIMVDQLKEVNRDLDGKVNQLSSLFDLSKEFSGILEKKMVGKLVVFSLIGQLMVSRYAIIVGDKDNFEYLETKFNKDELDIFCKSCELNKITKPVVSEELKQNYPQLVNLGISLIIPMQIKGATKGLILLGPRISGAAYTASDIEFVSSVGSLAIISIENAHLFAETLEKEKLEKDLELARKIQQNLLPGNVPVSVNFDIAATNEPARQVGGDYYDLVQLDKENLLFAIGDVSGKGAQAALIMANTQAFLKSICKQKLPLDESTNLMNDLLSENTVGGGFVTFFWGILNDKTLELEFVNAGHNPPLLIRKGKIEYLKKGGMILGVMPTMIPYEKTKIQLEPGDLLVSFTDGITEAMSKSEEEYSDERLEELSLRLNSKSAGEILSKIVEDVKAFTAGAEQSDDITSLIIKVK